MPKPHVSLPPWPAIQLAAVPPQSVHSSLSAQGCLQAGPNKEHLCLFQDLRPMHSAEVTKAVWTIKSSSDDSSALLKWPWMASVLIQGFCQQNWDLGSHGPVSTEQIQQVSLGQVRLMPRVTTRHHGIRNHQDIHMVRLSLLEATGKDLGQWLAASFGWVPRFLARIKVICP